MVTEFLFSTNLINFWVVLIFHFVLVSVSLAISGFFEFLIIFIILSIFSTATESPNNMWALSSAFFKSNLVFLVTTSSLNFKKDSKKSFKLQFFGFWSTIAKVLKLKEDSNDVYLYSCLLTVSGSVFLFKSIATLIPSRFDSSLISLMPSIFLSLINSTILSFNVDLFIW